MICKSLENDSFIEVALTKPEKPTSKRSRRKGFTLLELLVALGIVSISFLAIIPLLINTMGVSKSMSTGAKAKDIAVQKVEELMSLPRDSVDTLLGASTSYTSPPEYLTDKGVVTTLAGSGKTYTRTFSINQVPGVTVDPKPVALTCVVQYVYKGEAKSRSFTTMWSF